ncbi:MAG: DUF1573 domain-containing protein [Sedimentisphaerales bacterium]|nr:DUF1573 domain-containing protein [Sedimentisphaerales bacterium]
MKCVFQMVVILMVIGGFLYSAGAQEQPQAQKPAPETEAGSEQAEMPEVVVLGPKIKVENPTHDFGKMGPGSKNKCEFRFKNVGDDVLKISKVTKTCGCTVPQLSKKEYEPGESGTVKVTYSASKRAGAVKKHLYIQSNDKSNPKVTLAIKGEVENKIGIEPKSLKLTLKDENAGCPPITITSLDKKPFSIKKIKSTGNCIFAEFDPSEEAEKFVLKPEVSIAKLQKNPNGRIDIELTHPSTDRVTVNYNLLSRFKVDPPKIIVFNAEPNKPTKKEVWILNNYGEDFEIESASSEKGIIKILSQEKVDGRYKFELEITPPETEDLRKIFTDELTVRIKDGEKLRVTCRGFFSRKLDTAQAEK